MLEFWTWIIHNLCHKRIMWIVIDSCSYPENVLVVSYPSNENWTSYWYNILNNRVLKYGNGTTVFQYWDGGIL